MMRDIELMLKQNGQKKKEMIEIQIQFIGRNINRQSEERKKNDFTTSSNMTSSVPTEKKENPKQEEIAIDL
jgi:hypothetical protein